MKKAVFPRTPFHNRAGVLPLLLCCASGVSGAPGEDLFSLSLEELLQVEVSTVTRRSQSLSQSAAAVYVLTAEDIASSSALNIPDLLRMVPGMEVAQIDANKWAVSARGFNSRLSSKLLVFIDGRMSYVPAYATVFWESEDLILGNIERIEIIRGPGASIWGANAVNGVVSITTKSARDSLGTRATVLAGDYDSYQAALAHGARIGENSAYRISFKSKKHKDFGQLNGGSANDDWGDDRIEFRLDSRLSDQDDLMFKMEAYEQGIDQLYHTLLKPGSVDIQVPGHIHGHGLYTSTRVEHGYDSGASLTAQFNYEYRSRDDLKLKENFETYDLDLLWNNSADERHGITLGGGARIIRTKMTSTEYLSLMPENDTLEFYNLSLHDNYRYSDRLLLGLGLKLEHNVYTGLEFQANANLNYELTPEQNLWLGFSRAVRTPSRVERDGMTVTSVLPAGTVPEVPFDIYLQLLPAEQPLDSEYLHSLEAGWRYNPAAGLRLDVAAFFNDYRELRSVNPRTPYCSPDPFCLLPPEYIVQPYSNYNIDSAQSYGLEAVAEYSFSPTLSAELGFSFTEISYESNSGFDLKAEDGSTAAREDPQYKITAELNWLLSPRSRINASYRFVGKPGLGNIDAYSVADIKYSWSPSSELELSIAGRNLGSQQHQEFIESVLPTPPTLIEQSLYLQARWNW